MDSFSERIIKRYGNRKLYDTLKSTYITVSDITRLVRQGISLKVIDNKTGEDLTKSTLAQINMGQTLGALLSRIDDLEARVAKLEK